MFQPSTSAIIRRASAHAKNKKAEVSLNKQHGKFLFRRKGVKILRMYQELPGTIQYIGSNTVM